MAVPEQSFKNHARVHPPFHFVLVPLLLLHFVHTARRLWQAPTLDNVDAVLLAFALIVMALLTRVNALRAQDRVIRLEERLRYERVLSPEWSRRAGQSLTESQMIALRFASDEELPGLVERTVAGQLKTSKEIKQAITRWRADHFRV